MKKLIFITICLSVLYSCKNKDNNTKVVVTYPLNTIEINVYPNQWVLCPARYLIDTAIKKGFENAVFVYYPRKVIKMEKEFTLINELKDTVKIPNCFIIPLSTNITAKKGDLLLTWWQKGTGMQRALVLNVTQDNRPIVFYLDVQFYFAQSNTNLLIDTLNHDTYRIIDNESLYGNTFMVEEPYINSFYTVVAYNQDSILGLSWAGTIKVFHKKDCYFPNINQQFNVGDSVLVPYLGSYSNGVIRRLWNDVKKADVTINFLGDTLTTKVVQFDMIKTKDGKPL